MLAISLRIGPICPSDAVRCAQCGPSHTEANHGFSCKANPITSRALLCRSIAGHVVTGTDYPNFGSCYAHVRTRLRRGRGNDGSLSSCIGDRAWSESWKAQSRAWCGQILSKAYEESAYLESFFQHYARLMRLSMFLSRE